MQSFSIVDKEDPIQTLCMTWFSPVAGMSVEGNTITPGLGGPNGRPGLGGRGLSVLTFTSEKSLSILSRTRTRILSMGALRLVLLHRAFWSITSHLQDELRSILRPRMRNQQC